MFGLGGTLVLVYMSVRIWLPEALKSFLEPLEVFIGVLVPMMEF